MSDEPVSTIKKSSKKQKKKAVKKYVQKGGVCMSRFEESKLMEHEGRLDAITQEIMSLKEEKPQKLKMTKFKVVAIEFSAEKFRAGEEQVNLNLSYGYEITKDFQTDSGLVVIMTKWDDQKEMRKDANLCTYFPSEKEVQGND